MLIDITLKVTPDLVKAAQAREKLANLGHLGTHFDIMRKEFPLDYVKRKGVIFDVSDIRGRDVDIEDIELSKVMADMFVAFYTGFIEEYEYGSKEYFYSHPQLSNELIDKLLAKRISIIGVDCAGIRRGKEHTAKDKYCADHGVFVVENLCNLGEVAETMLMGRSDMTVYTFPVSFSGITGLPCRVVADIYIKP